MVWVFLFTFLFTFHETISNNRTPKHQQYKQQKFYKKKELNNNRHTDV
jgi:hypothetical protein